MRRLLTAAVPFAALALAAPLSAQQSPPAPLGERLSEPRSANVAIVGHVVEPRALTPDMRKLRLPDGYRIDVFAEGLGNARMLAVAEDGTVYLTRRTEGDVMMLRDSDGDGRADVRQVVARRPQMHGIAIDGDTIYLTTVAELFTAPILADGRLGPLQRIVDNLPAGGQHPNRTVGVGPDDRLYVSVGSTCNACGETDPENATMVRMAKDGSSRQIFASGLRNTIGFDWHPQTGVLWGLDHGIDWLGDTLQPEELNRIEEGKRYGWPYIYFQGGENPQDYPPNGLTMADWKAMSEPAVLGHDAHAAPMGLIFYRGTMLPAADQGQGFATFRGSWNRQTPSGYEVLRLRVAADGQPQAFEPFVTGFLQPAPGGGYGHIGRPVGIAEARDGALLFTDDVNGIVYRVSHAGDAGAPERLAEASPPPPLGRDPALAGETFGAERRLGVASTGFEEGAAIPKRFSAYGEGISPPLRWSAGPAGTKSYALIMEDPDAPTPKPFLHWTAWNIPAGTTSLEEAVEGAPQLALPKGMRQGRNDRGTTGYFGPRPPAGSGVHTYHVQIFALDTELDLLPGASRAALLAAMEGHVLAKGGLTGTYRRQQPAAGAD